MPRLCPICREPMLRGVLRCIRCGHAWAPTSGPAASGLSTSRVRGGGRWLFALALVVAIGIIPGLIDLSSLLVNTGPDRPALERSRRAEALFRAELPKAGLKPESVERRGQWSLRVTLARGWEALPPAEKRRAAEAYAQLWARSATSAGIRPA